MTSNITKVSDEPSPRVARRSLLRAQSSNELRPIWILAALTALGILLAVTGYFVRLSTRDQNREAIETVLAAKVSAIELWIGDRRHEVDLFVGGNEQKCQQLLGSASSRQSEEPDTAIESLNRRFEQLDWPHYTQWMLINSRDHVVASNDPSSKGMLWSFSENTIEKLQLKQTIVAIPSNPPTPSPMMLVMHPISDGLLYEGCIALAFDPAKEFSELLLNESGHDSRQTYALNNDATLISRSPHERLLQKLGLIEKGTSVLGIDIRDPGVDLTSVDSFRGKATSPLTFLADQATRKSTGSNVDGYNDYLGRQVIGAWQWLPEHDFAIATEQLYEDAYAGLHVLWLAFLSSIGFAVLASLGWMLLRQMNIGSQRLSSEKEMRRRLGQYTLGSEIGRGGMGAVYYGQHQLLKRDVAVKVLEQTHATDKAMSRFEREVQMTAKLRHPNTIEIYDYGKTPEGTFFYVMEYVRGISLQDLVDHYGRQPPERVIYLLLQICGSISEAHKRSMVHRDIKPANILVASEAGLHDMIKVLDFGLVKEINHETVEYTQSGSVTGTPLYMSPESVRDASKSDERSDLYSIGAVGYTLLTGLPTFEAGSSADICALQLKQTPVRPSDRIGIRIAADLENLVMSCLRKKPEKRPNSVADLANALSQCQDAQLWSQVDARQWWEQVFEGPRDDSVGVGDNADRGFRQTTPKNPMGNVSSGPDTKTDEPVGGVDSSSETSEKTTW